VIHSTETMGGPSETRVAFAPSVNYFVVPNLTIGAALSVASDSATQNGSSFSSTAITVLGRLGYNVPLGRIVSLWLRAGVGYLHNSVDSGSGSPSLTLSSVILLVDAPILIHVAPHFFIGAGPVFLTELSSSASQGGMSMDQPKTTAYGQEFTI